MILRPYQTELYNQAKSLMESGVHRILIQSPTGSGKTALTANMLGTAASKGMSSLFIVHRRELVKQSMSAFSKAGVKHGVIAPGFIEDSRQLIQIGSVQTLTRRIGKLKTPTLIIWDEAHHIASKSWSNIFLAYPNAYHIGLTATPERLDGKGLGKYFTTMISGPTVSTLIADGFLSPYRLFSPPGINIEGLHTRMGDFINSELSAVVDRPNITGDAIKHYLKYCRGKRAVVFCASIQHSKHVTDQFNAAGISAAHVDGETDAKERDKIIKDFESGKILILCNVELFGEGFDLPSIEAVICLRPTQSLGLHLQQIGRGLRIAAGKETAIILDHAGNTQRHGLPDQERAWSLDGRQARMASEADKSIAVKTCPHCFATQFAGRPVCGFCGHTFIIEARNIDEVDGELVELDLSKIALVKSQRKQEERDARTYEDLVILGKQRGYNFPEGWAKMKIKVRQDYSQRA